MGEREFNKPYRSDGLQYHSAGTARGGWFAKLCIGASARVGGSPILACTRPAETHDLSPLESFRAFEPSGLAAKRLQTLQKPEDMVQVTLCRVKMCGDHLGHPKRRGSSSANIVFCRPPRRQSRIRASAQCSLRINERSPSCEYFRIDKNVESKLQSNLESPACTRSLHSGARQCCASGEHGSQRRWTTLVKQLLMRRCWTIDAMFSHAVLSQRNHRLEPEEIIDTTVRSNASRLLQQLPAAWKRMILSFSDCTNLQGLYSIEWHYGRCDRGTFMMFLAIGHCRGSIS